MRGEYEIMPATSGFEEELPPRARRIHTVDYLLRQIIGTTSACAENTVPDIAILRPPGNYLRVRGEYSPVSPIGRGLLELPPRARRILQRVHVVLNLLGTTSACAENTFRFLLQKYYSWNYLRVRGEYPK